MTTCSSTDSTNFWRRCVGELSAAAVIATAQESTGLSDFGGDEWREALDVLAYSLNTEAGLTEFGEVVSQTPVSVQLKVPRAHVTETARRLLEACDISDISVQEMPIEDVIRALFGERRTRQQAMPAAI